MSDKTSQKKIESNRNNARKSTGPKTAEGKRAVRFNALKHGILAKEVVIDAGDGKESRADFTELLTQLQQELQPEGILEEMQVEKIAACYWRLRRAQRAEVGEIRKDLDTVTLRDQIELTGLQAKFDEENRALDKASSKMSQASDRFLSRMGEPEKSRKEADTGTAEHAGIEEIMRSLERGREAILKDLRGAGYLDSEIRFHERLREPHSEELKELREGLQQWSEHAAGAVKGMADLVGAKPAAGANLLSLCLPPKEAVDKILRYETAIERQLYRAMNQLERLQRRRLGDIVPPPIHVELSTE